jgi:hypothetical protein
MNLAPIGHWMAHLLPAGLPSARHQRAVLHRPAAGMLRRAASVRELPRHITLRIERPGGMFVECLSGTVWITHDGQPKDLVLEAGEHYQVRSDAVMLVHAMSDARVLARAA